MTMLLQRSHVLSILFFRHISTTKPLSIIRRKMSLCKPLNILVVETSGTELKNKVASMVDLKKYMVYTIQPHQFESDPWQNDTGLLVLKINLESTERKSVAKYLENGGKVIDFGTNVSLKGENYFQVGDSLTTEDLSRMLEKDLKIEVDRNKRDVEFSPGFMVGHPDYIKEFLEHLQQLNQYKTTGKIIVDFNPTNMCPTNIYLPVKYEENNNFNLNVYMKKLNTRSIGQLLLYVPCMTSSQDPFTSHIGHGFVIVPEMQAKGVGRGGNSWISPFGCLMFSIQMVFPLHSIIGKRCSLLQHITALAVVKAVRDICGIYLGLKWPNDIYFEKRVKMGGVIATANVFKDNLTVTVGTGFNLNNSLPTTCLNNIIQEKGGKEVTKEELLAGIFNTLEELIDKVNNGDWLKVEEIYYDFWIHQNQQVKIRMEDKAEEVEATIIGIDEYGFLRVENSGEQFTVSDDGNSFDMMAGLIRPKSRK